jgi:hypothetical protein
MAAAILLGKWFQSERKALYAKDKPWYMAYLSVPGLLILVALSLPIIIWIIRRYF